MKRLILFALIMHSMLQLTNAQPLIEKSFQYGYYDESIFIKRNTGFASFTSSWGDDTINPFLSFHHLVTLDDSANIINQPFLDSTFFANQVYLEVFNNINLIPSSDGNYILSFDGNGCDYDIIDNSHIFKISPQGQVLWHKRGYIYNPSCSGTIPYQLGYINYSSSTSMKWSYFDNNGAFQTLTEIPNAANRKLFSDDNKLYLYSKDSTGNSYFQQIDTNASIIHSYTLPNSSNSSSLAMDHSPGKVAFGIGTSITILDDTLHALASANFNHEVTSLQFDNSGKLWALLNNNKLIRLDSLLNTIQVVNLDTINNDTLRYQVNWFSIDSNTIYYAGMVRTKAFIKSFEINTLAHFQNLSEVKVTQINISNEVVHLNWLNQGAPYSLQISFDVQARIKNTGQVALKSLFLNCSNQIGFYICNKSWLLKRFDNLNLQPGDSMLLNIGTYRDNGYTSNPNMTSYPKNDFCIWPSIPNDTWAHQGDGNYCFDFIITNIVLNTQDVILNRDKIALYPNPNDGKLYVDLPSTSLGSSLEIRNLLGECVLQIAVQNQHLELNIEHLTPGIYWFRSNGGEACKLIKR
jgi:hypothetical protein